MDGRVELTDFFEVVFNPNILYMFPHVLMSRLATAGFFVLAISAYHLLTKTESNLFRRLFQLAGYTAECGIFRTGYSPEGR